MLLVDGDGLLEAFLSLENHDGEKERLNFYDLEGGFVFDFFLNIIVL